MRIFVTGGTGFVGEYILNRLRREECELTCLVRKGSESRLPYNDHMKIIHGDLVETDGWRQFLAGVDVVIHLVGIIRERPKAGVTFDIMHREATSRVVEAAQSAGVKKIVHMSANGASAAGVSGYQVTKYLAEEIVKNCGLDYTIFRPSVIFGNPHGRFEFVTQLAQVMKSVPIPLMAVFGDGSYLMAPVAVENVAECFVSAALDKTGVTSRQTYHLTGPEDIPYPAILDIIASAALGKTLKKINIPLKYVLPVADFLGQFDFFPVTGDQIRMLVQGNTKPPAATDDFKKDFGIQPAKFSRDSIEYIARG